jgi:DNA invertase Pin-like site-specific DNA recombinase
VLPVSGARRKAARFGCTALDDKIYFDSETSGNDAHRDGYKHLLAGARARAFDSIIVEGQDRLWRHQAEMHAALRKLTFWGIKVFSVATGTDLTDKAGKLIATVFGWKDEAYLDDLRNKTRRGLARRVGRGLSAGGRSYGYRTVPVPDPEGRMDVHGVPLILGYRREIQEREAEAVRRIFQLFADGYSPKAIAKQFNVEKVPPPRPKGGQRAQGWAGTAIYGTPRLGTGILNNPLYAGRYVWNRFAWIRDPETGKRIPRLRPETDWIAKDVPELRIVPDELWQRVKARQADIAGRCQSRQGGYAGHHPKYLLSGLLRCGGCHAHYIIRSRNRYVCSFNLNRGSEICSNILSVGRLPLERRVVEFLRDKLCTKENLAYLVDRVQGVIQERLKQRREPDRDCLPKELAAIEQQLANVERAILEGGFGQRPQLACSKASKRDGLTSPPNYKRRPSPTVSEISTERSLPDAEPEYPQGARDAQETHYRGPTQPDKPGHVLGSCRRRSGRKRKRAPVSGARLCRYNW